MGGRASARPRASDDERDRLEGERERVLDLPAAAGEGEHEGDRDVLDDQDRQHEVGLVVGQPAEVDQPLDGHRRGRDVDRPARMRAANEKPNAT